MDLYVPTWFIGPGLLQSDAETGSESSFKGIEGCCGPQGGLRGGGEAALRGMDHSSHPLSVLSSPFSYQKNHLEIV